jgi:ABC-type phosphate transport system substrate-binding protein
MKSTNKTIKLGFILFAILALQACENYYKDDYKDNSPTSGKLKVYYDEGLRLHVKNQVATFESQYPKVELHLHEVSENHAVQALYNDSCESIILSRKLTDLELKAFASKQHTPNCSAVAKSGIAIIANAQCTFNFISYNEMKNLLLNGQAIKDSLGNMVVPSVLFDKNNSSVLHYMLDTILGAKKLSAVCNILNSTQESIDYVATHANYIALIDFAWLSDADDSIYKANKNHIKFIGINKPGTHEYAFPNQSSFKLETYPLLRTVYVYRKTGDFTLAKGFESFVAGPKGQLTFLKQGLLPTRQAERRIEVNME